MGGCAEHQVSFVSGDDDHVVMRSPLPSVDHFLMQKRLELIGLLRTYDTVS